MALAQVLDVVENRYSGVPMSDVTIRAFDITTDSQLDIYADVNGTPLPVPNVATTDADGMYNFFMEEPAAKLRFYVGGSLLKTILYYSAIGPAGPAGPANSTYASTAALEAASVSNLSAILAEAGKAGTFTVRAYSDFAAQVAADSGKINYIRSSSDPTKVWVRDTIFGESAGRIGTGDGTTVQQEIDGFKSDTGSNLIGFSHASAPAIGTLGFKAKLDINAADAPFNAKFDDVTDDTQSLLDAMDYAAAYGATIHLPRGRAVISDLDTDGDVLVIPTGVTLLGENRTGSILRLADGSNVMNILKVAAGAENVTLRNFCVDGNRDNIVQAAANGISGGAGCKWITYEDLLIQNTYGRGLMTNSDGGLLDSEGASPFAEFISVNGVSVRNCGQKAIQTRRTRYANVRPGIVQINPIAGGNGDSASCVEVSNGHFVTISGAVGRQMNSPQGPGYRIVNGSRFVTVDGGVMHGGRQPVIVIDSQDVTVENVTAYQTLGAQISNSDETSAGLVTRNVTFAGLKIIDPVSAYGVIANISDNGTLIENAVLRDCMIVGPTGATMTNGILVQAGSGLINIVEHGNIIRGNTGPRVSPVGAFTSAPPSQSEYFWSGEVTLADDAATGIDAPSAAGSATGIFEVSRATAGNSVVGIAYKVSPTIGATALYNGSPSNIDVTTGVLTGTTGTDGRYTVSAASDGKIYIENRTGGSAVFRYGFRLCR